MQDKEKQLRSLTPIASTFLAGYLEPFIDYPWIKLKIDNQAGFRQSFTPADLKKLLFQPSKPSSIPKKFILKRSLIDTLYRGLLPFQITVVSSVLIQERGIYSIQKYTPIKSDAAMATLAGVPAGIIANAMERTIVVQEQTKSGFSKALKFMHAKYGWSGFMLGAMFTISRESGYSWSIWHGNRFFSKYFEEIGAPAPNILGATVSGFIASTITHAPDTIGTKMHATNSKDWLGISKTIMKNKGVLGFFPGFMFRNMSIIGASYFFPMLYDFFNDSLPKLLAKQPATPISSDVTQAYQSTKPVVFFNKTTVADELTKTNETTKENETKEANKIKSMC